MIDLIKDTDFLKFAAKQESQFIASATDFTELAVQSFEDDGVMQGLQLPWPKTRGLFALRKGEVTLWAGINGHGKSQLLGQICALTLPAAKWLIASLEMPIKSTLNRMLRQMTGCANPSEQYIRQLMATTDKRLWIYDQQDTVAADRIIAMIHYAAAEHGVEQIILDSLVKCGMGVDDYNAQKSFVDRLCWVAKQYNIHIHLVHHVRKSEKEGKKPDKFDIKGAGEITDLVDNVVIVHRNKDKEEMMRKNKDKPPQFDDKGNPLGKYDPDTTMNVVKQRHAGIESQFNLYFHAESQQFLSAPDARPFPVLGVVA